MPEITASCGASRVRQARRLTLASQRYTAPLLADENLAAAAGGNASLGGRHYPQFPVERTFFRLVTTPALPWGFNALRRARQRLPELRLVRHRVVVCVVHHAQRCHIWPKGP